MGERPDEIRRDPLGGADPLDRSDALGEGGRDAYPDPDPAFTGGVAGGVEVDEVDVVRTEVQPPPPYMGPTARRAGLVGTIRANPLPAALTGIGLGWMIMNARKQSSKQGRYRAGVYTYDYPPPYDEQGSSVPSPGQAVGRARDRAGETATQVQDKAGQVASQAQDKAGQVAGQAQDRVSRLGDQARYQARRASGGFQRMLRENPLAVGALGVGVGAAVGLAIPETAKEHEVMGEARDTLVEKAQEKAQDAQQRVQRVAEEAQGAAQQEAENQGLTQQ
jgi:ElaB/YqjD/DUF883 family membrane-anchored ribosome-binding protein